MKTRNLKLIFAAMLGACLGACDSNSGTAAQAAGPSREGEGAGGDFDRSVLAIKAMTATQEEKNSAIEALASRYGHIVVVPKIADPVIPDDGILREGPLAKAATYISYQRRKEHYFGNDFVLGTPGLLVQPGGTFTSWTARPSMSTADPFLVAYYVSVDDGTGGQTIKVVGLNDDNGGTLDSKVTWTNQTASAKWVHAYAFAYSSSTGGTATIVSLVNGGTPQIMTDEMHGIVEYNNNSVTKAPAGCGGPLSDMLALQTISDGGYTYGIMMVNSQSMKGGIIYNERGNNWQTLTLPGAATPSGYPNFMLWFATSQQEGSGTGGEYIGTQYQAYTCPG